MHEYEYVHVLVLYRYRTRVGAFFKDFRGSLND